MTGTGGRTPRCLDFCGGDVDSVAICAELGEPQRHLPVPAAVIERAFSGTLFGKPIEHELLALAVNRVKGLVRVLLQEFIRRQAMAIHFPLIVKARFLPLAIFDCRTHQNEFTAATATAMVAGDHVDFVSGGDETACHLVRSRPSRHPRRHEVLVQVDDPHQARARARSKYSVMEAATDSLISSLISANIGSERILDWFAAARGIESAPVPR